MAGRAAFAANQKQAPGFVVGPNGLWLEKITEGRGGWEGVPAAPFNREGPLAGERRSVAALARERRRRSCDAKEGLRRRPSVVTGLIAVLITLGSLPAVARSSKEPQMNKLDMLKGAYARDDLPEFRPGDTVKVHVRVVEGNRERTQVFEGVVIARNGSGLDASFTVRKVSFGVGVERVFPVNAPIIQKVEVTRRGDVRRSKLYYLRDRVGKAARIKEKRD